MPPTTNAVPVTAEIRAPQPTASGVVAVLGLGYVGLPTSLGLLRAGFGVIGFDVSERRLREIQTGSPDLGSRDRARLAEALDLVDFALTSQPGALHQADAVVICVPTPVDDEQRPDLRALRAACATVVQHARRGQTIVLTSTSYVGTTRELLIEPLERRGLRVGSDVFVAFSPERIDPGNEQHAPEAVPRVVGPASPACRARAASFLAGLAARLHLVSSPEAAELTKLYENTFRAVNIAFANEMAGVATHLDLDPTEVVEAAATKPYGFMAFRPGPGVGGHCIPCDPHYLLQGPQDLRERAPLMSLTMDAIERRPSQVAERAHRILCDTAPRDGRARVLVVGAAYKPGVRDVRESPALEILAELLRRGHEVSYHDPLVRGLELSTGLTLLSVPEPRAADYDLAIVMTVHPDSDCSWLADCPHVLDCTYRTPGGVRRHLL